MSSPFSNPEIIERQKIFEQDDVYVLYNIAPNARGRCLVVPKRRVLTLRELTDSERNAFFRVVQIASEKLQKALSPCGFNYGINEGSCAGQTVMHLHMHIIPRFSDDNLPKHHLFHREKSTYLTPEELAPLVEEFKELFKD